MKTPSMIAALALLVAAAARAEGPIDAGLRSEAETPKSTVTREQVRAELKAARDSGELAALTGEDSGSFYFARVESEAARYASRQMLASKK